MQMYKEYYYWLINNKQNCKNRRIRKANFLMA